jgi:predicted ATP-dependent endonuclease of OLD family
VQHTQIKDLRHGLSEVDFSEDREFLLKYLTLTKCDLFFADKAMLIEGPTERLLMPLMIEKMDVNRPLDKKLSSQYVSIIEVGGAYAHHFFRLLNFLELKTLIITDLDSVKQEISTSGRTVYKACKVGEGTHTSNACIKNWFNNNGTSPSNLIAKTNEEKIKSFIRLAYQIPEEGLTVSGRSFEDAFMLANQSLCELEGASDTEKADNAWEKAIDLDKKTDFALQYVVDKPNWNVPHYIKDGLLWLAEPPVEINIPAVVSEADSSVGGE